MRKKSIRKNKTNRKKTYRKKSNRKKSIHKKTNRKNKSRRRNKQRGGLPPDIILTEELVDDMFAELEEKEAQLQNAAALGKTLLARTEELQEENENMAAEFEQTLLKKTQQLTAEFERSLIEKTKELQEENEDMKQEIGVLRPALEEADYRVEEQNAEFTELTEAWKEDMRVSVETAMAEGEKLGYEAEKSENEERLKVILKSVNQLGIVTGGDSYTAKTDTEHIEGTLEIMASAIEGKIKQQIELGTAEATQSLMKAQMEQATLHDRILELEKEVEEAGGLRDKAIKGKDSALVSLEKEISKNLEIIARNQEVVKEHVNAKKVLREQNKTYEAENTLYRNDNTELREQNEKLTIELAKKEDCIEKTRQALGDGEEGGDEDDDLE